MRWTRRIALFRKESAMRIRRMSQKSPLVGIEPLLSRKSAKGNFWGTRTGENCRSKGTFGAESASATAGPKLDEKRQNRENMKRAQVVQVSEETVLRD
jgi:hypothetical protein